MSLGFGRFTSISDNTRPALTKLLAKLLDPKVFVGERGRTFDNWLINIRNKLEANHDHFPTKRVRIVYVISRINGDASSFIMPRIRPSTINAYTTTKEILYTLERVYSNPNRYTTAKEAFRTLYQRERPFNDF
jgi:hypothetical protein